LTVDTLLLLLLLLLPQITFREIIAHYKRQAHAKQEVFRTVVLQQTDPQLITQSTGDIIAFYNAVSALFDAVCQALPQLPVTRKPACKSHVLCGAFS
jgi:hypothetical protein